MVDRIRLKVDEIFQTAPHNKKIQELKEELIGNLEEKYQDLITCGKTEQEAFDITIASIGDIDELIHSIAGNEGIHYKKPDNQKKVVLEKQSAPIEQKVVNKPMSTPQVAEKKPENKMNVAAVTILSCIGVLLLVLFVRMGALMGGHGNVDYQFGEMVVAKEESTSIDNIEKITTQLYDADVEVSFWNEKELKVIESTNDEQKNNLFTLTKSGDTIKITRSANNFQFTFGNMPCHKVELFIPESFKDQLKVATTSGYITCLTDIEAQELAFETSSGDISSDYALKAESFSQESSSGYGKYDQIESEEYALQSSSGDITINALSGEGKINTTSGYVAIGKITGEKHEITTSSGDIKIDEGNGDFKLASTSGLKQIGKLVGKSHSIKGSSGDVNASEIQGKCEIEGSSTYVNIDKFSGEKLKVDTTSGDIRVNSFSGAFEMESSSGYITMGIEALTGDGKINTTSADINLSCEGAVDASFEIETTSGSILGSSKSSYEDDDEKQATATWGTGDSNEIELSTTSGNVTLND